MAKLKGINSDLDCAKVADSMNRQQEAYAEFQNAERQAYDDETAKVCDIVAKGNEQWHRDPYYIAINTKIPAETVNHFVEAVVEKNPDKKSSLYILGFISGLFFMFGIMAVAGIIAFANL